MRSDHTGTTKEGRQERVSEKVHNDAKRKVRRGVEGSRDRKMGLERDSGKGRREMEGRNGSLSTFSEVNTQSQTFTINQRPLNSCLF